MAYKPKEMGFVNPGEGSRRRKRVLAAKKREVLTRTQRRHRAQRSQHDKRFQESGGKIHLTMAYRQKVNRVRAAKGQPPAERKKTPRHD